MQYVFIRQSLQLHANIHIRERKLPTLRTYAEKYLKLLPEIVRADGLGWCTGSGTGAYGQMHLISLILQSMRDGWISADKMSLYKELLRKLFLFFFMTFIDQEQGVLVVRDGERDDDAEHTTRVANFDAARYLCQWSRLARTVGGALDDGASVPEPTKPTCRYISFDRCGRKEQGLCVYRNPANGLHVQIPLVSGGARGDSDSLAFPHMPGVFDVPVGHYVPAFIPEWTIGGNTFTPSFYGKNIAISLGMRNAFRFTYEQPELITKDEKIVPGVGTCRVEWEFLDGKMTARYTLQAKQPVQLDSMRFVMPIAAAHSRYHLASSFRLGEKVSVAPCRKTIFKARGSTTKTFPKILPSARATGKSIITKRSFAQRRCVCVRECLTASKFHSSRTSLRSPKCPNSNFSPAFPQRGRFF